ncbi:MAG: hypothetical protein E3J87_09375 [Candidatus Cloacimonadota bacterium]|nr:MAG: hypothetical protein E3J87_09375 [Candidatus Cloacimonadota bacterium]
MKRVGLILIIILCNVFALCGSVSKLLKWKGTKALSKAKIENVMIDSKGYISLSPDIDTIFQSTEIFLWDCVIDSKGNLYVSSGNEGKVFRVSPSRQIFTVFTSEKGAELFALAVDKKDNVYIGESPSGIIYRLSKNGKVKEFYKTGEKYVWRLLFDNNGMLFAATGDRGKLFKISSGGKGEIYYSSKENHIISLLFYKKKLYVGTEPNGLFIEITRKDKATVLYDTKENEIRSMVGIENSIFFATITRPSAVATSSFTSFFSGVSPMQGSKKNEKSVLYKFDIDKQTVSSLWECPTPPLYSISEFKDGRILIGTESGRLYTADKDGKINQLNQFETSPILNIIKGRKKNSFFLLTGNLGNVIKMGPDLSKKGEITSEEFDTGRKSSFGRANWDVILPTGTSFTLKLRIGNKENPDEDWTDWKEMKKDGEINLLPGRFIQLKSELRTRGSGKSPLLKEVSISYLPENRRPVIKEIIICPAGVSTGESDQSLFASRTVLSEKQKHFYKDIGYDLPQTVYKLEKGKRCAYWTASDPDGDSLYFSFFYRGEEEKEWKELKKELKKPAFVWDETALPDGVYYIKVSVSDERENPSTRALSAELTSEPFVIDNTSPVIEVNSIKAKGKNIEVKVTGEDKLSILKSVSYSVNGGEWNILLPDDGIFDSKKEEFLFTIKENESGEYTVVVKVTDLSLNTGVGKGTVEVK